MKSFHKIKLDRFLLKVNLKNLMLKTYYELGLFENALSLIDSYRHFLSNDNTLSAAEKKKNRSFVNFLNQIIRYRLTQKPDYKVKLVKESENVMPSPEWVREKMKELYPEVKMYA